MRIHRFLLSLSCALIVSSSLLAAQSADNPAPGAPQAQAETREQRAERERQEKDRRKAEEQQKRDEERKKKLESRQQQQQAKQAREFEKVREFTRDLYGKNVEFKDAVDVEYGRVQRHHSELAFVMNTWDTSDERVTRTGDTYKIEDTLYDNPLVQQYVNRLGQSLVPKDSRTLYVFRVKLNPIPEASALSTGTIYISTGFISLVDNEAQLAYILGHEIAHVEREHWKEDVLIRLGHDEYEQATQKKRRMWGTIIGAGAAVVAGKTTNDPMAALSTFALVAQGIPSLMKLAAPTGVIEWDSSQETEADRLGLQFIVNRNYDPDSVPALHGRLLALAKSESRASFGFMADPTRVAESEAAVRSFAGALLAGNRTVGAVDLASTRPPANQAFNPGFLAERRLAQAKREVAALSEELKARLASGDVVADSGKFQRVMAELKRDNGIQAFYYDMFRLSLTNLSESLGIYADDPSAQFAYGRVLWLTARSAEERGVALEAFEAAVKRDGRGVLPQAHLYKALALIDRNDPQLNAQIVGALQTYVQLAQRQSAGALPPDMSAIYDYLQQAGELKWAAHPSIAVSAGSPLEVRTVSSAGGTPQAAPQRPLPKPRAAPKPTTPNEP